MTKTLYFLPYEDVDRITVREDDETKTKMVLSEKGIMSTVQMADQIRKEQNYNKCGLLLSSEGNPQRQMGMIIAQDLKTNDGSSILEGKGQHHSHFLDNFHEMGLITQPQELQRQLNYTLSAIPFYVGYAVLIVGDHFEQAMDAYSDITAYKEKIPGYRQSGFSLSFTGSWAGHKTFTPLNSRHRYQESDEQYRRDIDANDKAMFLHAELLEKYQSFANAKFQFLTFDPILNSEDIFAAREKRRFNIQEKNRLERKLTRKERNQAFYQQTIG